MVQLSDKVHMLETMKHDQDINVKLERKADKHTNGMSAELSAFFIDHVKDDHIDKQILKQTPNSDDVARLHKWSRQIPKSIEKAVKQRKMLYLGMGASDMEMYVQAMVGMLMLPLAVESYKLMEATLHDEFVGEYQRQSDELGLNSDISDSKVNKLSHKSFDNKTPQKAFWMTFDKSVVNVSLELTKAIQQGVSAKEWSIITGG
ncbi:hypothetical protein [Weissella cibaria]|uniref:hypothetical protein n=1 Tax=Weissella cibaria TaxID=137591 RepID=UPI000EEC0501|nr:hypothetical protein [Weissella cibaria]MDY2520524.1 hypothetical protein [Weissella cibaria]HCN25784.1 hypothetical protein [Weissella cibaria]HCU09090.1 hypothetical protein [Weissella cibaria]